MQNATVDALVRHPLGRVPERALRFTRTEDGQWTSSTALPAGRWIVHLTVRSGGEEYRQIEELL
jgi:nitrogen fixation protein FixH